MWEGVFAGGQALRRLKLPAGVETLSGMQELLAEAEGAVRRRARGG